MAIVVKTLTKVKLNGADASFPVPTVIVSNITPVSNTGGGEDDLMSDTIPANTLATVGDTITWKTRHFLTLLSSSNLSQKWYIGGSLIAERVTEAEVAVAAVVDIVRIDSDSVLVTHTWFANAIDFGEERIALSNQIQINGLNFAAPIVLKTTGTSPSNTTAEVSQSWSHAVYYPVPPM